MGGLLTDASSMLKTVIPALVLVPLVLLTSCGSSDPVSAPTASASPSASPTAAALDKAAYLAASEAVCAKANAALQAIPLPTTLSEYVPGYEQQLSVADAATTQLEALTSVQPDAAELQRIFIGPLRAQVTAIRANVPTVQAAVDKGQAAIDALGGATLPEADTGAMTTYGFKACVMSAATS